MEKPDFIVVMGVSGTGKTEIARALAARLDAPWIEADAFHDGANVERMRRGEGLTDELRWPWLRTVAEAALRERRRPVVIACSALRRSYRDFLRQQLGEVMFAFLDGPFELIEERLCQRRDHFAGSSLLASQFATLEPPSNDERCVRLPIEWTPRRIVDQAAAAVG